MDDRCVIFYDSGIGGLYLLKKTAKFFPNENLLYYADFKNMPYGNKNRQTLLDIGQATIEKLKSFCPKLIVVACNTMSTILLESNSIFGVNIIYTLPKVNKDKSTLLLCTNRTAKSNYVKSLQRTNNKLKVLPLKNLAKSIEDGFCKGKNFDLKSEFPYFNTTFDEVSLGCTHYSLIQKELSSIFPCSSILDCSNANFIKIANFLTTNKTTCNRGCVLFVKSPYNSLQNAYNLIKL